MDTARYIFAVMIVTFLPPGLAWWFVVHPFVGFWRRVGVRGTLTIVGVSAVGAVAALMMIRDRLVGTDLGTHSPLLVLAALLLTISIWIAMRRKKHLTTRILAGVPELDSNPEASSLLSQGIYGVIRHPRYVEIVIGTLAYAVFSNYLGAYVVAAATIPLIHLIVLLEERELLERFGAEYEEYRRRVPRYVPRGRGSMSAA